MRIFLFLSILVCVSSILKAEPAHTSVSTQLDLSDTTQTLLSAAKQGGKASFCSPELYHAGKFLEALVLSGADSDYAKGKPGSVHAGNDGLARYFANLEQTSPDLKKDAETFFRKIREIPSNKFDSRYIDPTFARSYAGLTSQIDYWKIALEVTHQNVFRAATLLGYTGSDDVGKHIPMSSSYFARKSLGNVEVRPEILQRYLRGGHQCVDTFRKYGHDPFGAKACQGGVEALDYHIHFGFFLGCQLAKRGFGKAWVRSVFVDALKSIKSDPFINADLEQREKSDELIPKYHYDICTDLPKMLGYFYKRTTLPNWLSPDAAELFHRGYVRPFQSTEKDPDKRFYPPEGWSKERFEMAIANLDFRLMHLEYGAEQARAGAEAGAKACAEYKKTLEAPVMTPNQRALFETGILSAKPRPYERERLPADLVNQTEIYEGARRCLAGDCSRWDYSDQDPKGVSSSKKP